MNGPSGNLAACCSAAGRLNQAEDDYRRALSIKGRVLGSNHPEIAVLLNNLAVVLKRAGRVDEARACFRRAAGIYEARLGRDHPSTVQCRRALAALDPSWEASRRC